MLRVLGQNLSWYFPCSTSIVMNTTNKKTTSIEIPEPSQDTEGLLLERLRNSTNAEDYFRWMLFVVGFYRGINKVEAATELLESFIKTSKNVEQSAHCHLALGQIATDEQRLDDALRHFLTALELAPKKQKVAYVLENNVGYCLNQLKRFVEAEQHCRVAIEIDWKRASGYRNLGISLLGQRKSVQAAWALTEAVKLDSTDERAKIILQKILADEPNLLVFHPWILQGLNSESNGTPELPLM